MSSMTWTKPKEGGSARRRRYAMCYNPLEAKR